jgi:hypothetical protein
VEEWNDVDKWKKLTNSRNRVRKKSFGGTFCFSNCHIIRLDTGGQVFLVSGLTKALTPGAALALMAFLVIMLGAIKY